MFKDSATSPAASLIFDGYADFQTIHRDVMEANIGSAERADLLSRLQLQLPGDWALPEALPSMPALMADVPLSGGSLAAFYNLGDEAQPYRDAFLTVLAAMCRPGAIVDEPPPGTAPPLSLRGLPRLGRQYFRTWGACVAQVTASVMAAAEADPAIHDRVQRLQPSLLRWFGRQWCNPLRYGVVPQDLPGALCVADGSSHTARIIQCQLASCWGLALHLPVEPCTLHVCLYTTNLLSLS